MSEHIQITVLHEYIDGEVREDVRREVHAHVRSCLACTEELRKITSLRANLNALRMDIQPARDLWGGIAGRLQTRDNPRILRLPSRTVNPASPANLWVKRVSLAAAVVLVAFGGFWWSGLNGAGTWQVARVEGVPSVGGETLFGQGKLDVGTWLETDDRSRATVEVGSIGQLQVDPGTRLRILQSRSTDHRIALARGTIHATIWAPPRIFFVETPSATAIDLGCAYTLQVDDEGGSLLDVTHGWVALELAGVSSIIPAGASCRTTPGVGPGLPFYRDAAESFRRAAHTIELGGTSESLTTLLADARARDALTLWHLLFRLEGADRALAYDRLMELAPHGSEVTRAGVLAGNRAMLQLWADELGIGASMFLF